MNKTKILLLIIIPAILIGIILGLQATAQKYKTQFINRISNQQKTQPSSQGKVDPSLRLEQMEKDEDGCFNELSYYLNEELGVCTKFTEIEEGAKPALIAATDHVGPEFGLRIRRYLNLPCETCYKVKMAVDDNYFTVRVKDGQVVDYYEEEELGVGSSIGGYTTIAELVYNITSNILNISRTEANLEQIDISWNDGDIGYTFSGIGRALEDDYGSQMITDTHNKLLSVFEELNFTPDEINSSESTDNYSYSVFTGRDAVCTVLLERNPVLDNSSLQVACAEY